MSSGYLPRYSASGVDTKRNSSIISTQSMKNGLKTIAQKYKEHDRQVQNAWEAYYGVGQFSPHNTAEAKRNVSTSSEESTASKDSSSPSALKKAAKSVRQHLKEHHNSVNAAYATLYGDSRVYQQRGEAMKQYTKV